MIIFKASILSFFLFFSNLVLSNHDGNNPHTLNLTNLLLESGILGGELDDMKKDFDNAWFNIEDHTPVVHLAPKKERKVMRVHEDFYINPIDLSLD